MQTEPRTLYASKLELIRACKVRPGIVLVLDGGDGWKSHWVSDRKGKEPRRIATYNPQGMLLAGM